MDSLTHALAISAGFALLGRPDLIPFAVLGAVIPDIDVTFQRFSDRDPAFYIFTHGGITHSLIGGCLTAAVFAVIGFLVTSSAFPAEAAAIGPALAIGAAILGVLSHLLLDYLAYPGIPLLYPFSDRKFTPGIMAGPSVFLTVGSLVYLAFIVAGKASISEPLVYGYYFIAVLLVSACLKAYVSTKMGGTAIPGFIPVKWLIVNDNPDIVRVCSYDLFRGLQNCVIYARSVGSLPEGYAVDARASELRRMRYHSYTVVETYGDATVLYSDPLREHGHLWYPPYFKSVTVPVKKAPGR